MIKKKTSKIIDIIYYFVIILARAVPILGAAILVTDVAKLSCIEMADKAYIFLGFLALMMWWIFHEFPNERRIIVKHEFKNND
jgi:hypothetical protein